MDERRWERRSRGSSNEFDSRSESDEEISEDESVSDASDELSEDKDSAFDIAWHCSRLRRRAF